MSLVTYCLRYDFQQIQITPQTAVTGWSGETLALDHAVGWLMQRAQRMKNVSAETFT
ncbi:MAG TPA: hypothetical protein VML92_05250 [Steroidobacteraceae bacterium]|nr:hypothetical protein [Steroidobacteraceae bacterium]